MKIKKVNIKAETPEEAIKKLKKKTGGGWRFQSIIKIAPNKFSVTLDKE